MINTPNSNMVSMADPFGSSYQKNSRTITPTNNVSNVSPLLKIYETLLQELSSNTNARHPTEALYNLIGKINLPPTIPTIETFLSLSRSYEMEPLYSLATGLVATKMIKTYYRQGIDTIVINLDSIKPLDCLCFGLQIKTPHSLTIYIKGRAGDDFAREAEGGTYVIEKAGHSLGMNSYNSTFFVQDAASSCCFSAHYTKLYAQHVGQFCGAHSSTARFFIEDADKKWGVYSSKSTFYTPSEQSYNYIRLTTDGTKKKLLTPREWTRYKTIAARCFARVEKMCMEGLS